MILAIIIFFVVAFLSLPVLHGLLDLYEEKRDSLAFHPRAEQVYPTHELERLEAQAEKRVKSLITRCAFTWALILGALAAVFVYYHP